MEPLPPFLNPHFFPCRHFSTHTTFNMSSIVETTPHLRVSAKKSQLQTDTASPRISPPNDSAVEDKFFWTYTEEPHRSRRQAIIKAHPEVCEPSISCCGAGPLVCWYLDSGTRATVEVEATLSARARHWISWNYLLTSIFD